LGFCQVAWRFRFIPDSHCRLSRLIAPGDAIDMPKSERAQEMPDRDPQSLGFPPGFHSVG
jgi:hypothetical protein